MCGRGEEGDVGRGEGTAEGVSGVEGMGVRLGGGRGGHGRRCGGRGERRGCAKEGGVGGS